MNKQIPALAEYSDANGRQAERYYIKILLNYDVSFPKTIKWDDNPTDMEDPYTVVLTHLGNGRYEGTCNDKHGNARYHYRLTYNEGNPSRLSGEYTDLKTNEVYPYYIMLPVGTDLTVF